MVAVNFKPVSDSDQQDAAERLGAELNGCGVKLGGFAAASADVNEQVGQGPRPCRDAGVPRFSSCCRSCSFAASWPRPCRCWWVASRSWAPSSRSVVNEVTEVSVFALNLTTGLGLGLAIDYSLFIVARYREEIAKLGPGPEALRRTMATAGRTVVFSSITVAAALASLLVFPQKFLYSMGLGGSLVALIAAGVALLVLPAVLALLGNRVDSLSPGWLRRRADVDARPATEGFWYRLSRLVMRRPGTIAAVSATVLVLAGLPFLGIKFTAIDASVLPDSA